MPTPTAQRWVRLKLKRLPALMERGWVWTALPLRRRQRLVLVSPRGTYWEFKLHHGAWVRRVEETEAQSSNEKIDP